MKKIFSVLFVMLLISCGGGGSYEPPPVSSGAVPTGDFAGQVDPVQATD